MRVLAPAEISIEANTLGHSLPTLPDGISGELIDVASGAFARLRGRDAHRQDHALRALLSPARHEKQRISAHHGRDRLRDDELGAAREHGGAVRLGEAGVGQPDAGDLQDRDGDAAVHRHRAHRGPQAARDAEGGSGARLVPRQRRERLAAGADHGGRGQGPRPTISSWSAAIRIRGPARRRPTMPPAMPASWSWRACSSSTATSCAAASCAASGPATRPAPWSARPGSSTATGTGCASTRSPICRSTSPPVPAPRAGAPPRMRSSSASTRAVEKRILGSRPAAWRRAVKNGDASFFGLGVPMLAAQGAFTEEELKKTALAKLGWWHHSIENTIDKLDFDFMQPHLRVYAAYLWELCTAPVLPFEYVAGGRPVHRAPGPAQGRRRTGSGCRAWSIGRGPSRHPPSGSTPPPRLARPLRGGQERRTRRRPKRSTPA